MDRIVTVIIDRPLGSTHPEHSDLRYPVNYGYVPGIIAPDGEEQDAYILGVDAPLEVFEGQLIAILHRLDDVEDKWVVVPVGTTLSESEIMAKVNFQERFFQTTVEML